MQNSKGYDETLDVTDPEDIPTPRPPSELLTNQSRNRSKMSDEDDESYAMEKPFKPGKPDMSKIKMDTKLQISRESSEDDGDDDDDDEDDDDDSPVVVPGAYNPADYEHLEVSQEINELFQYIQRYTPQSIDLETKLRPFIPDYIPAVGDIDAFIKVPRPDLKPDNLGLRVLDEPCAQQSDPTVLDLQLRALSKQTTSKQITVRSIPDADRKPKEIDSWIKSITDLHRNKPPPSVHYSKNMPDVDTLMQVWPPEVEELLKSINLPNSDIDCNLSTFIDLICGVLDIPVYNNHIQSLHLLFTVYNEFKNSQHFQSTMQ